MDAAAPMIDHGLGMFGFTFVTAARRRGQRFGHQATCNSGRFRPISWSDSSRRRKTLSPEFVRAVTPPGYAGTWSEIAKDHPKEFHALLEKLG